MFVNKNAHSHKCLLHNLYNQKTVTFLKSVIYFKKGLISLITKTLKT